MKKLSSIDKYILLTLLLGIILELIAQEIDSEELLSVACVVIVIIIYYYFFKFIFKFIAFICRTIKKQQTNSKNIDKLKNLANYTIRDTEYKIFNELLEKNNFSQTKQLKIAEDKYLLIDDKEKNFAFFLYNNEKKRFINTYIEKYIEGTVNKESIETISCKIKQIAIDRYKSEIEIEFEKYKFSDLLKVDVIDKTSKDTQRTFTIESNTGNAIAGAFLGEFLLGGAPSAIVGAIAGAAGERQITENVVTNTFIAYDVVIYLNKLNNNVYSIRVNSENELRELVGVLEYILNNK